MQQSSRNVLKTSFNSRDGDRWTSSGLKTEAGPVKVLRDAQPSCRIHIVDRDSMSADLLADALNRDGKCQAITIGSTHLLPALEKTGSDLVVIGSDLNSKSESGFDLTGVVSRAYPDLYIAILLDQTTQEGVVNAFRTGARAVFSRQQPMSEFLDLVQSAQKGYIWAGRSQTSALLEAFQSIPSPVFVTSPNSPQLTARETQVVQYAATGRSNRNIAREMGLSEHTVKNYLFRAFDKLGVSSRVELLFYLALRGHQFHNAGSKPLIEELTAQE